MKKTVRTTITKQDNSYLPAQSQVKTSAEMQEYTANTDRINTPRILKTAQMSAYAMVAVNTILFSLESKRSWKTFVIHKLGTSINQGISRLLGLQ